MKHESQHWIIQVSRIECLAPHGMRHRGGAHASELSRRRCSGPALGEGAEERQEDVASGLSGLSQRMGRSIRQTEGWAVLTS